LDKQKGKVPKEKSLKKVRKFRQKKNQSQHPNSLFQEWEQPQLPKIILLIWSNQPNQNISG